MIERKIAVIHDYSGKILRVCNGSKEGVELTVQQDGRDHIYVDTYPDMENSFVSDGKIIDMPTKPSENCNFNYDSKAWDYDLTEAKREAWDRIKRYRAAAEFGTFTWSGNEFQCDEISQARLRGAVLRAQIDTSISVDWMLADNTSKTFNAEDFNNIGKALEEHVNACHVKAQGLRTQINGASTQADLDAIKW